MEKMGTHTHKGWMKDNLTINIRNGSYFIGGPKKITNSYAADSSQVGTLVTTGYPDLCLARWQQQILSERRRFVNDASGSQHMIRSLIDGGKREFDETGWMTYVEGNRKIKK